MCGGGEASSGACNEVVEEDFPGWHAWNSTRAFARRPRTSPPVVIGRNTEGELREAIKQAERRAVTGDGYWPAVMAARREEMGDPADLPRRDRSRSYWPQP